MESKLFLADKCLMKYNGKLTAHYQWDLFITMLNADVKTSVALFIAF
jgi:hypothetical protein